MERSHRVLDQEKDTNCILKTQLFLFLLEHNTVDCENDLSEESESELTSSSEDEDSADSSAEEIIVNSEDGNCDNELENNDYDQFDPNEEKEENHDINLNSGAQDVDENLYNLENRSNIMLYEGNRITLDEAVFDLLNLYVKHDLTKAALGDALEIQLKLSPENNLMPKTVYRLL
ncbi:uncharacterized protein LOC124294583 [Neodiprion lecontei]|uniref:Uncharacterized protein LOC124294583 n=1 Tax=Neodiprion lecontei TaxID=441921 RepID=A0ABM3G833_NEOLC|nr:uncharacterized protein LOC124294583 [Neodiprion lecontei]